MVNNYTEEQFITVLKKNRPHELMNVKGKPIEENEARKIIPSQFQVSQDIRRERQRQ
jgi:UDP-N-acetylglucosamine pyrophosphorylase